MACRRTRKLWGHWGVLASTATLTLLSLAIPGIAQAASADVAGAARVAIPSAPAVPAAAVTAATSARSIASTATAHASAAMPAAQPAAAAVAAAEAVAQKVTSSPSAASAVSSQPSSPQAVAGGSSSSPPPPPPAVHSGSASQPDPSPGSLADTIVRHVETEVSAAIPHNVRPDSPVPSQIKAIVADPVSVAHQGAPVTVVGPSSGRRHRGPSSSWRPDPRSSSGHASASRTRAGTLLAGAAAPSAWLAAAPAPPQSASLSATGDRPGAVAPPTSDATGPPGSGGHARDHLRTGSRAGRVDIATPVGSSAPATAAVAPAGSEGTSSGVGAGGSAAAAAIVGLAGLGLLRALLPGLLTLDIFPWQSTLRAMRLERPG